MPCPAARRASCSSWPRVILTHSTSYLARATMAGPPSACSTSGAAVACSSSGAAVASAPCGRGRRRRLPPSAESASRHYRGSFLGALGSEPVGRLCSISRWPLRLDIKAAGGRYRAKTQRSEPGTPRPRRREEMAAKKRKKNASFHLIPGRTPAAPTTNHPKEISPRPQQLPSQTSP